MMNCGAVRDRISCGPRAWRSIFITQARTRSPTRRFSFGIICSRGSSASRRPDSMMALPRSMRFTVPVTSSSPRDRKSLQDLLALGVADALQDHLLGGLRADAAELDVSSGSSMKSSTLSVGLVALLRFLDRTASARGVSSPARRRAPPSSGGTTRRRRCSCRPRRARRCPRCTSSWSPRRAPSRARRRRCRAARSSRAPARPPASPVRDSLPSCCLPLDPSQFRYQLRPLDVLERQRHCLSVDFHLHLPRLGAPQHADELRAGRSRPACASAAPPSARRSARNRPPCAAAGRAPARTLPAGRSRCPRPRTPASAAG